MGPTEKRLPESRGIDTWPTRKVLALMHREDQRAVEAVGRALPEIERAVEALVERWRAGGRLIYVGAGTSGRIGALDAAELPPTFGVEPERAVAIIAGGPKALWQADEGAEDDVAGAKRAVTEANVAAHDFVVGLSASGRTPFVLAFIAEARTRGAATAGVTSVPGSPLAEAVDYPIVVETGAEVVAGSTRLKAGTAQKLVLNMLSTAAMVRLGKVYDGWMIDVQATNSKLRRRVRSMLGELTGASAEEIDRALGTARGRAKVALLILRAGLSPVEAQRLLASHEDNVREALRALGAE